MLSGGVPFAFLQRTTVFDFLAEVWWSTAEETLFEQQPTLFDEDNTVYDDEDQPVDRTSFRSQQRMPHSTSGDSSLATTAREKGSVVEALVGGWILPIATS